MADRVLDSVRVAKLTAPENAAFVVRFDAYPTIALPGEIPDDVRGGLRAAAGSETPA